MTDKNSTDLIAIRDAYVRPFYLNLGANITRLNAADAPAFQESLAQAARQISDEQIQILLNEREWRGRLTAAWLVGLSNRQHFVPLIGDLLLASQMVYAGQGYCLALALIGGDQCAFLLRRYLDRYLPLNGRFYDQAWAIGALAHLEGSAPATYLRAELWRDDGHSMDTNRGIEVVANVIAYLRSNNMISH